MKMKRPKRNASTAYRTTRGTQYWPSTVPGTPCAQSTHYLCLSERSLVNVVLEGDLTQRKVVVFCIYWYVGRSVARALSSRRWSPWFLARCPPGSPSGGPAPRPTSTAQIGTDLRLRNNACSLTQTTARRPSDARRSPAAARRRSSPTGTSRGRCRSRGRIFLRFLSLQRSQIEC